MVRRLAFVLAWLGGVFPGWAYGLGLGEFKLHSYLNQPLDGEIRLLSASQEDLDSLRVSLASPAQFARAGIDYREHLRALRLSIAQDDAGPVIEVRSEQDFREPYLNFLVEVTWSKGQILREYTALVDPPTMVPAEAPAPAAPVSAAPERAAAEDDRFPRVPVDEAPAPAPAEPDTAAAPSQYGPTERNDTLWQIAKDVRPDDSISIEQAMLALLRENPEAFIDNNINQLKAGYVLDVPSAAAMRELSASQARAESARQYREWRGERQAEPTRVAEREAAEPAAPAEAGAEGDAGRLELLAPETGAQAAGESEAGAAAPREEAGSEKMQKQLALAQEAAEAQRQENEELRSRLAQLEETMQNLEKLVELKDEQMAALQKQLTELRAQQQQGAPAVASEAEAPTGEAEEAPAAVAEAEPGQPEAPEPAAEETATAPVEAKPISAADYPNNAYAVEGYQPVDLASLPDTEPAQPFKTPQAAEPADMPGGVAGLADRAVLYANQAWSQARANPLWAGGAAGAVLVLLLAALVAARRRRAAPEFQESILQQPQVQSGAPVVGAASAPEPEPEPTPSAAADASEQKVEAAETSYLSDFAVSGMDSLQSEVSEADPLTEADVFLAYGRFQPAEAMIKEAIESEPDRLDYKVKLLEIYYAAKNREAFENEAQALREHIDDPADSSWAKVVEMGRDLAPDHPLFAEGDLHTGGAEAEANPFDISFDEAPVQEQPAAETEEPERARGGEEDNLLDFDLSGLELPAETEEAGTGEAETASDQDLGLDFDLEDMDKAQAGAGQSGEADELASDLASELEKLADSMEAEPEAEITGEAGEQQAESLDFETVGGEALEDEGALWSEPEEEEEPKISTGEPPTAEEEQAVVEGGLAAEVDEVGTKLDLARAYIDMGDPEGARSILDEVIEEGNDDQQREAQELIGQIS